MSKHRVYFYDHGLCYVYRRSSPLGARGAFHWGRYRQNGAALYIWPDQISEDREVPMQHFKVVPIDDGHALVPAKDNALRYAAEFRGPRSE